MTTDAVGGIWTYALDLGAELRRRGTRVTLALLGPGLDPARRHAAEERGLALIDTGLAPDWLARDEDDVASSGQSLRRLASRLRVDLVHLNHPALGAHARFRRPVVAVCHSCVATWWSAVRGAGALPDDLAWRAALTERGLAAATVRIAPTRAFAEANRLAYGFSLAPHVVPNGSPPCAEQPVADGPPAASVLTAGRLWDEGKNVAALDRAASRVPVPVRAAGPIQGPNGTAITLHHTQALGSLDPSALRARLGERPIYVSPALYEPFGLAVLEAARAGCALVLSDLPTFREIWDGVALFVPPHDDRAIAAAIVRLLGDPVERGERARRAAARAGAFTIERTCAGTQSAYAAALAAVPPGAEAAA